ncbi:MAG: hypothetical protein HQ546_08195, partial [Planctomycetes bacterium]|nr:hypothetical protein [Planctomycetota bacterium]
LPTLLPGLQQFAPAVGVEVRGSLVTEIGTGSPIGKCNLTHAVVTMNALSAAVRGRRPTVDGSVQVEGLELVGGKELVDLRVRRLWSDDLRLTVGPTEATVVLDLKDPLDSPRGSVTVLAEEIDAGDLLTWLGGASSPPALTEEYRDRLGRRVAGWIALAKRSLAGADLAVFADIGLVRNWPDRKVRQLYDAHNVIVRAAAAAGRVELEYTAGVNGGTLIDSFAVDLTAETPELTQLNTIRDMMATKNLQPQVTAIFPGNELRGSLWRELHLSTPLQEALANALDPRLPVHAVGEGVTTMFEGITRGRAAPRFVTRVFPGLNLVEYEYDRMVSFSEFRPDGSAYNDMIFSGKVYDIYIEGTTDARQIGRYEVGLILLGTPESPLWNHRYKQGRIPLLKFKASIIDGRKLDEEVSYPWPNQTMFTIFLKNNYFYRLWVESRKNNTTAVDQHAPAPGNGVPTTSH